MGDRATCGQDNDESNTKGQGGVGGQKCGGKAQEESMSHSPLAGCVRPEGPEQTHNPGQQFKVLVMPLWKPAASAMKAAGCGREGTEASTIDDVLVLFTMIVAREI